MRGLSNITIAEFRRALLALGLEKRRMKGGHEAWLREGMTRPVIIQTHKDPIPEFIVRNDLKNIGVSKADFLDLLERI